MKKLLLPLLVLTACATPSNSPIVVPSPKPSSPAEGAKVLSPVVPKSTPKTLAYVRQLAANSACLTYSWKNRGHASKGYIKGMAETMVRSICRQNPTMVKPVGDTDHDGLAWYGLKPTLVEEYTLLTGLGMRESSGTYCDGYDTSAGPETADTAEAGLFQVSWNSHTASPNLPALMAQYVSNPETCKLETFKENADCPKTAKIIGTGDGAKYQAFAKSCPAFAVEYAAILLRVQRKHWGPINRKEAEVNVDCRNLFTQVQAYAGKDACTMK